jgi:glycosyltransferase involved in cell wall biosynthesis
MIPKIKILLICDLKDWILYQIADQLKHKLSKDFEIIVLISHEENFFADLIKNKENADIVHFLSPWDFFEWGKYIDRPIVVTVWHMVDWKVFDQKFARIDLITTGSEQWKRKLGDHILNKIPIYRLVYGIDIQKFSRDPTENRKFIQKMNVTPDTLVFGFAGSTWSNEGNRKGIERLFNCLIELKRDKNVKFILRITGRGWQKEIVPPELQNITQIESFLESSEVPRFYSSLDFYVCTSSVEGVPYPVLESMACECVVLTTPVGIVPEIINNSKNGFILNESTITSDFVKNIEFLRTNQIIVENISKNARKTIINQFDWNKIIESTYYKCVYKNCKMSFSKRSFSNKLQITIIANFLITFRQIQEKIILGIKKIFRGEI